jgi:hypothetical protein
MFETDRDKQMIQFFINSRPVPRAIARHRLEEANPRHTPEQIAEKIQEALANEPESIRFLGAFGVEIHRSKN